MDRVRKPAITVLAVLFLLMVPKMECQVGPPNRPLCISQLAIVNHACSLLPYSPIPPPPPDSSSTSLELESQNGHGHGHHQGQRQGQGQEQGHGHGRRHGQGQGHGHGHGHGNGHGGSHHRHRESAVEEECCRWLKQVDSVCVCELLVHLPPFLAKPVHQFTVLVDETCSVTFTCEGRIRLQ